MAQIRPGRASKRPGYLTKQLMLRELHGKIVASAWPKPQGPSKLPYMIANRERMKIAQKAVKLVPPTETIPMNEQLKKFLREHRGVRGTAAIRMRDLETQRMFGTLFQPILPNGKRLAMQTQVREVSDWLDWIEPRLGGVMIRTKDGWRTTTNCKLHAVMMQTIVGAWPQSCPLADIPGKDEAMGGY